MDNNLDLNKILKEVTYNTSRSGGKGGQNINKVETKVELVFNVFNSLTISGEVKKTLSGKLAKKLDSEGNIRIVSQTERTQLGNKKKTIEKFVKLIDNSLKKEKIRIKTVKSLSVKEKILDQKKKQSFKKKERKFSDFNDY